MAGHSHSANVKHRKDRVNAAKAKVFSKIAKMIIVAAKLGGGDPDANPRLRLAVEKARAASMPKDNIERAIKRATGEQAGANYEELIYEGYGPGGGCGDGRDPHGQPKPHSAGGPQDLRADRWQHRGGRLGVLDVRAQGGLRGRS
jgi:hypothetical protein